MLFRLSAPVSVFVDALMVVVVEMYVLFRRYGIIEINSSWNLKRNKCIRYTNSGIINKKVNCRTVLD